MSGSLLTDRTLALYQRLRPAHPPLLQEVASTLRIRRGSRLLDVGCGPGTDLAWLRDQHGACGFGVELRQAAAAAAAAVLGADMVVCADALAWLRSTALTFDAALVKLAAHHLQDVGALLEALFRRLQPGGRVAIVTMFRQHVASFPLVADFPSLGLAMQAAAATQEELPSHLSSCGFIDVDIRDVDLTAVRFEPELVDGIRAGYVSFFAAVPHLELEAGITRVEDRIRAGATPAQVKGVIVHGCVPDHSGGG